MDLAIGKWGQRFEARRTAGIKFPPPPPNMLATEWDRWLLGCGVFRPGLLVVFSTRDVLPLIPSNPDLMAPMEFIAGVPSQTFA